MKRIARQFTYPTAIAVATVLLAFVVLASPSPSRAASQEPGLTTAGRVSKVDRVEARIKDLQTKLKITPAQEEQWSKVTQEMRDDAKKMEALITARSKRAGTMNAIEDLKSYAAIAEAHADGLKKFIVVFEPFYASMSDAQKKDADVLFQHQGRHGRHGHTKAKAKAKGN
jgi:periplasmic protein CpxP/Spy